MMVDFGLFAQTVTTVSCWLRMDALDGLDLSQIKLCQIPVALGFVTHNFILFFLIITCLSLMSKVSFLKYYLF